MSPKDKIQIKRKEHRELIRQYREKLAQELQDYCVENGGHFWEKWTGKGFYNVIGDWIEPKGYICMGCELRKLEE